MGLRRTGSSGLGPLRVNYGTGGVTSLSVKVGPLTYRLWSRTGSTGLSSVNLPGRWSYRPDRGRRARRESR